jgi:signal transduction histidine kinase
MSARRLAPAASALAGAGAALVVGYAAGMADAELGRLALLLGVSLLGTLAGVAATARLLARASLRRRMLGVTVAGAIAGLANLAVLAGLMLVDHHDAVVIAMLLVYSLGVGVATALALGTPAAGEMVRRIEAARRRERAVEAQRRDLIVAVSHDLRTPLSSLRAMTEALDEGVVSDPDGTRRYVAEMRSSIESLVALVDDLFEFVRLDAAAIEAEAERATVAEIVEAALAACDGQAHSKGLRLETRLDGAGEALCSPRLTRVVQNLLQNAIRHTPADGTVRVEAHRGQGAVCLTVEDSGEGISPGSLERIFDPFWRGDAARTSDGSGLGLTLAKRIVESLGGRIDVESAPASGSRFAVLLPERR